MEGQYKDWLGPEVALVAAWSMRVGDCSYFSWCCSRGWLGEDIAVAAA